MDAQDIRNLQEAYKEVYHELDEAEVLAARRGVPGTVQVKDTKEGGFFGIGGRTVSKPVPGTFKEKNPSSADAARYNTGIDKKFGIDPSDTHSTAASSVQHRARSSGHSGYMKVQNPSLIRDTGIPNTPSSQRAADQNYAITAGSDIVRIQRLARARERRLNQSFDLFDVIKGHLLDEGYADNEDAALAIMANMSEEWRETIIEAEVLAKKGGVEGVGTGANWKAKSWTGAEKSRYSSYKKPTAPAANSSGDSPKAPGSAPARPQTTKFDVDLYNLQSRDDRRDFERRAMASGKSPVEYQRKLDRDAEGRKAAEFDAQDTAGNRQSMYQKAMDDAREVGSWYGYNPNDPKDRAEVKKLAMTNYNRKLAILQNRSDFDPSKYDTDDFQPKQRT